MTQAPPGRLRIGAALLAFGLAAALAAGTRADSGAGVVVHGPGNAVIAHVGEDAFCLHWAHSVTGGAVADCFEIRAGILVLVRSYLHDHAAGLGETPGRGKLLSAEGGGYWIEGINAPVPGNELALRVGALWVGHRIVAGSQSVNLSALAAGQRVSLRPAAASQDPG